MSDEYYYFHDGKVQGAISLEEIRRKVKEGELPSDVQVCKEGKTEWKELPHPQELETKKQSEDSIALGRFAYSVFAFSVVIAIIFALLPSIKGHLAKYEKIEWPVGSRTYYRANDNDIVCDLPSFLASDPEKVREWGKKWKKSSFDENRNYWVLPNGIHLHIQAPVWENCDISFSINYEDSPISDEEDTLEILRRLGLGKWTYIQGEEELRKKGKLSPSPSFYKFSDITIDKKAKRISWITRFLDNPYDKQ